MPRGLGASQGLRRVSQVPIARAVVKELVRSARPKGGRLGLLRLDVNERPVGFPASVTREILASLEGDVLTAYPEVLALYERLSAHHGLPASQLAITAGSEMGIRYLFEAFLAQGDRLVILDPSFAMFEVYGQLCGAEIVRVPFRPGCEIAVDDVLQAIQPGTRVVAIANPNNPTGTIFGEADMRAIITRAADVGAVFLSDEAYFYFHDATALPWLNEYPNLVVSRTFSKAWGLAGIRLGYLAGAASVIAEVQKLQPIDHVSALAVAAGLYMLDHESLVREYATDVCAARDQVAEALRSMGSVVMPSAGNFLLVDAGVNPIALATRLRERGVLVGTALRLPFDHQFIRVSIGPGETMATFLSAFRAAMGEAS